MREWKLLIKIYNSGDKSIFKIKIVTLVIQSSNVMFFYKFKGVIVGVGYMKNKNIGEMDKYM